MIGSGRTLSVFLLAIALVAGARVIALAQNGDHGGERVRGRITSIADGQINITRRDGSAATIVTTPETTFFRNGQPATLDDYEEGDGVIARGIVDQTGQFVARGVRGSDHRPNPDLTRLGGTVTGVDVGQNAITITTEDGGTDVIYATADTHIIRNRQAATVGDFVSGDRVRARGERDPNNQFIAERILGGTPPAQ
mgnify:CR=1 FL=1